MRPPISHPTSVSWRLVPQPGRPTMTLHLELIPLLSVVAGILVLIKPKLLNYVVGIYLIIIGLIEILGIRF